MTHFLAPLLKKGSDAYHLRNDRAATTLASTIERAFDSRSRRRGLLGRNGLAPGAALIIAPCSSVHTFFMRFPIDVVFARKDGGVLKICADLKPGRLAFAFGAFAAIELPAGAAARANTKPGDRLVLAIDPAFSPSADNKTLLVTS